MVNIIIADTQQVYRSGLKSILEKNKNFKVVGEASNGREVLDLSKKHSPDIVILDIKMPKLNGIEATKLIKTVNPSINVIILSMLKEESHIFQGLKSGALGYLSKDCPKGDIIDAVTDVMAGKIYLCTTITWSIVSNLINVFEDEQSTAFDILSSREREVLQLLAEGFSTKEKAQYLGLSVKTIETHRKSIMKKLNLHSIAKLTKYAIREGVTDITN